MTTGIALCDMDAEDIERSAIVSTILRIYGSVLETPSSSGTLIASDPSNLTSKVEKLPLEFDAALIPYKDECRCK